ncbi:MAG TPA: hypothetical protein VLV50_01430 [Stellaceae bacterium]|nr:hypothetical protein [Stellaceae bacterium]
MIELLSFVSACSPRRDEPADFAADRECDRDFATVEVTEDLIPDLAMAIRPTDESVAVENPFHISEIDLVVMQIGLALSRVPIKATNSREQRFSIFRHGEAPTLRLRYVS